MEYIFHNVYKATFYFKFTLIIMKALSMNSYIMTKIILSKQNGWLANLKKKNNNQCSFAKIINAIIIEKRTKLIHEIKITKAGKSFFYSFFSLASKFHSLNTFLMAVLSWFL